MDGVAAPAVLATGLPERPAFLSRIAYLGRHRAPARRPSPDPRPPACPPAPIGAGGGW
jgi:hypothetical protein